MKQAVKKKTQSADRVAVPKLSAQDIVCRRYAELGEEISRLERERAKIRAELEHRGTHSTRHFVVTVERRTLFRVPPKAKFLALLGPEGEKHLVKAEQTFVTVKRKGGGES